MRPAKRLLLAIPLPATITDAVVSSYKPILNSGRIDGTLRVLLGESFTINGTNQITSDLYLPGTPAIQLSGAARYAGTVSDGGVASPANYNVSLSGDVDLPGRIHTNVDPATAAPRTIRPRFRRPAERMHSRNPLSVGHRRNRGVGRRCAILVSIAADSQLTSRPVTTAPSPSTVTVDSNFTAGTITLPTASTLMAALQYKQPGL